MSEIVLDRTGVVSVTGQLIARRVAQHMRMALERQLGFPFDSATDGRARACLHSAFDDPTWPAHARPRKSIEARAFVFYSG
jgi:hypothetical protein